MKREKHTGSRALLELPFNMAASCYNRVLVALYREGERCIDIPQLRGVRLQLTPERWQCQSTEGELLLEWHRFCPRERLNLQGVVPCVLSLYHPEAANLVNTLLIEINGQLTTKRYATPAVVSRLLPR